MDASERREAGEDAWERLKAGGSVTGEEGAAQRLQVAGAWLSGVCGRTFARIGGIGK